MHLGITLLIVNNKGDRHCLYTLTRQTARVPCCAHAPRSWASCRQAQATERAAWRQHSKLAHSCRHTSRSTTVPGCQATATMCCKRSKNCTSEAADEPGPGVETLVSRSFAPGLPLCRCQTATRTCDVLCTYAHHVGFSATEVAPHACQQPRPVVLCICIAPQPCTHFLGPRVKYAMRPT